jgi:pimeloyl-ACP methyl ester carboxylesterase
MATFVLVHGSWHGGWCWRPVAPQLRAAGHEVFTPTLSGLGERSHLDLPRVDLALHIQDIVQVLRFEDLERVVLVGHSYAGMVITGVAALAPERLHLLVYLDAYVPGDGQSQLDLWPESDRRAALEELDAGRAYRPLPSPASLGVTDPALGAWVQGHLTPHPWSTYLDPPPPQTAASRTLPRAYIHCSEGGAFSERTQGFAQAARAGGWPVVTLATGHDAMVTEPDALARVLLEMAGAG